MDIKFNTLGVILNGVNPEEKFIKIIDGQENTGGFLILLSSNITLGLSKHDLNYKSRFEILFVCSLKYDENQIFPFLRWLAETIIENKKNPSSGAGCLFA